jgi:hypothetical protein
VNQSSVYTWDVGDTYSSTSITTSTGSIGGTLTIASAANETKTRCHLELHADRRGFINGFRSKGAYGICESWFEALKTESTVGILDVAQ